MEIQPILCGFQSGRRQRALMLPTVNLSIDQARVFQNLHVLADRRLANVKWGRQFANRRAALYESSQDAPTRAVRKSEKYAIELLAGLHENTYS